MTDFEIAKDKVMMGAERKSMVISDEEKKITAYHEAGHTLVGLKVPNVDPVHKVTIIPRGMALGVTMYLPGKGPSKCDEGIFARPDRDADGRAYCRGHLHRQDHDRCFERHREGD